MPEVIFPGPDGRLEGRYHPEDEKDAPIALILHPHPQFGGTMNNRVVYAMYQSFVKRGFSTLRFNFRGVGRSQGKFDNGQGELSDAATALDWMQGHNPNASTCWIAGFSFGAWVAMQLMMRRRKRKPSPPRLCRHRWRKSQKPPAWGLQKERAGKTDRCLQFRRFAGNSTFFSMRR